jgi:hypothetical protein
MRQNTSRGDRVSSLRSGSGGNTAGVKRRGETGMSCLLAMQQSCPNHNRGYAVVKSKDQEEAETRTPLDGRHFMQLLSCLPGSTPKLPSALCQPGSAF